VDERFSFFFTDFSTVDMACSLARSKVVFKQKNLPGARYGLLEARSEL
jgi:hypothetical protein